MVEQPCQKSNKHFSFSFFFHFFFFFAFIKRYVPDDDSPAVQLIFNNNSFARKYRQQIEQFIKGLLWEEFNSSSQDSVPEISVKVNNYA